MFVFFFIKQKTAYEVRISDWSSDVCSSDLTAQPLDLPIVRRALVAGTDIRYRDPQLQLVANINIDTVKARDTQFENDIRFSGSGTMRERPFTVRSEEHTSELQSLMRISYSVFFFNNKISSSSLFFLFFFFLFSFLFLFFLFLFISFYSFFFFY